MKSILRLKFMALYLIFGFLCIFTTATLTTQLMTDLLEEDTSQTMYRGATLVANDYLPSYFTDDSSLLAVQSQLAAMRLYLESSLWFVQRDGTMITSSNLENTSSPEAIEDFDPAEIGGNQYITGTYHGYFDEDMITVMAPVTQGFSTKGYLLIHSPMSTIEEKCRTLMVPVYISLGFIYLISFLFLLGFHFFVYRPLRQVTEAAKQYATGNLEYEIPVYTHDEMGYLADTLNFMSDELNKMEEYQKNFIANVSHDFRSPLTSIKGYLEAILDGTIPPELYEKYLSRVISETERLHKLTESMLALNSLDGRSYLSRSNFDINRVIKDTAASFEGTCNAKNIVFDLTFGDSIQMVFADMGKIQQVMYNLIDNAIKFSHADSTIYIQAVERHEKIFVSVKDTGIGIPKNSLTKIWERFYKTDLSRGKDKTGTGLGLSIVKEIIQAHGENIDVISTEGVGTEFIFSLPRSTNL